MFINLSSDLTLSIDLLIITNAERPMSMCFSFTFSINYVHCDVHIMIWNVDFSLSLFFWQKWGPMSKSSCDWLILPIKFYCYSTLVHINWIWNAWPCFSSRFYLCFTSSMAMKKKKTFFSKRHQLTDLFALISYHLGLTHWWRQSTFRNSYCLMSKVRVWDWKVSSSKDRRLSWVNDCDCEACYWAKTSNCTRSIYPYYTRLDICLPEKECKFAWMSCSTVHSHSPAALR